MSNVINIMKAREVSNMFHSVCIMLLNYLNSGHNAEKCCFEVLKNIVINYKEFMTYVIY